MSGSSGEAVDRQLKSVIEAISRGDLSSLQSILREEPPIEFNERTSGQVLRAVFDSFMSRPSHDLSMLYALLDGGADVNAKADRYSVLDLALTIWISDPANRDKSEAFIKALLEVGAKTEAITNGDYGKSVTEGGRPSQPRVALEALVEKAFETKDRDLFQLLIFSGANLPRSFAFDSKTLEMREVDQSSQLLSLLWNQGDKSQKNPSKAFCAWVCQKIASANSEDLAALNLKRKDLILVIQLAAEENPALALDAINHMPHGFLGLNQRAVQSLSSILSSKLSLPTPSLAAAEVIPSKEGGASGAGAGSTAVPGGDFSGVNPLFRSEKLRPHQPAPASKSWGTEEPTPVMTDAKVKSSFVRCFRFANGRSTLRVEEVLRDIQKLASSEKIRTKRLALLAAEKGLSSLSSSDDSTNSRIKKQLTALVRDLKAELSIVSSGTSSAGGAATGESVKSSLPFHEGSGDVVTFNLAFGRRRTPDHGGPSSSSSIAKGSASRAASAPASTPAATEEPSPTMADAKVNSSYFRCLQFANGSSTLSVEEVFGDIQKVAASEKVRLKDLALWAAEKGLSSLSSSDDSTNSRIKKQLTALVRDLKVELSIVSSGRSSATGAATGESVKSSLPFHEGSGDVVTFNLAFGRKRTPDDGSPRGPGE